MQTLNKIRTFQFFGLAGLLFGYLFVYRRFFAKKAVMNSVIYHQTLGFLKQNDIVAKELGSHIQVMNCNGQISPLTNKVDFDLILFGSTQKGKVHVKSEYLKDSQQWKINQVELFTRSDRLHII